MRICLILALVALSGCAHAGEVSGGVFRSDHFTVGKPGSSWRLVRNSKVGANRLVSFRHPEQPVDISVREIAMKDREMEIPLLVLAEAQFRTHGRKQGIRTELRGFKRIDVGEHEALAFFGVRSDGVAERQIAQIFLRAGHTLVILSYIAPPDLYPDYAVNFALALQSFNVMLPADPPEIALPAPF